VALLLAVILTAGIITLGRHKPRLGTPTWTEGDRGKVMKNIAP